MTTPDQIIAEVFQSYAKIEIGFVNADYWQTLRTTYVRTLCDVMDLAESRSRTGKVRILEIGAFCGIVATALAKANKRFEVTAWDVPMFMQDHRLNEHYREVGIRQGAGNLATLPLEFQDEAFDIIVCCEVIEHLNFNPLPVFCEFSRLLRLNGILYIGTPNQANIYKRLLLARGRSVHNPVKHLLWQLDSTATFSIGLHWKEYTAEELAEILKLTGFELLKAYYCHTNRCRNPNLLRRMLVRSMYACFPSFLPSQVAVGIKTSKRVARDLATLTRV